jgi:hypothetical protein
MKQEMTLEVLGEIVDKSRATGPDWQTVSRRLCIRRRTRGKRGRVCQKRFSDMAIYFGTPKQASLNAVRRSDGFVMSCSLEREERSLIDLKRVADRVLPFNYRLNDADIIQRSNDILSESPNLYATTWKEHYRKFGERLREDYERHRSWYEQNYPWRKLCEFSAPSSGLKIQCELPQSGIVGWGFTYFLQDNSANSDNVKIGYAAHDPVKRARTLLTGATGDLNMVAVVNSPRAFERLLHDRYSNYRIRGEWFSSGAGWDEFCDDDFSSTRIRDGLIKNALSARSLSSVFTADEYHGWLLYRESAATTANE